MRELSVFVDESGNLGDDARYYLLALVLHDQSKDVFEYIGRYESTLAQRGLRDIPLHMNPLMRANEEYKGMTAQEALGIANGAEHRPSPALASGPRAGRYSGERE